MKKILHIDIETYSSVDLKKSGLYKYVQSPDFEILLFAYAYDENPVNIVDLASGEKIPYITVMDLHRPEIMKIAHNAAFEFYCLAKFFETRLEQWRCTMINALYCGYPGSLAAAGEAMGLSKDKRKIAQGSALIRYFCVPCAPTQRNGGRTRNTPKDDPGKWNLFKEYCRQDVVTEREIDKRLAAYPVPESEWRFWALDQRINISGVAIDTDLVSSALAIDSQTAAEKADEARKLTGLDNPNSVRQLKQWIQDNSDLEIEDLKKGTIAEVLNDYTGPDAVKEMLKLRQEMSKTSIKKYEAMNAAVCDDGRLRGMLQFYGANRTGRWAGRLVQVHNLPRNYLETLDVAHELVKKRKIDALQVIYGNISDILSQLIRTAFVPEPGHRLLIADYSAIEARVIAWLSGEQWRLNVFNTHGKIYEASASAMFGVPLEKIVKGNPEYELRQKGKVAELALGYQGAKGALIQMGALQMGLTEEELPDIVKRWRNSNRRLVDFWFKAEECALDAIKYGTISTVNIPGQIGGITFSRDNNFFIITLPSGRNLYYSAPRIAIGKFDREAIYYMGLNQTTKKWEQIDTYGGKLVENIVQAVARDLLANALENLYRAGYRIAFHVHDEVVLEVPYDSPLNLDYAIKCMCQLPSWAAGLPINADGFETEYYKKD